MNLPTDGADTFRRRARELIASAWREHDTDWRRYMLNLAATYQRVADAIAPLPPAERQIFRSTK